MIENISRLSYVYKTIYTAYKFNKYPTLSLFLSTNIIYRWYWHTRKYVVQHAQQNNFISFINTFTINIGTKYFYKCFYNWYSHTTKYTINMGTK